MSELCGFVYNKGHQKSRETTREIWRSEGELTFHFNLVCRFSIFNNEKTLETSAKLNWKLQCHVLAVFRILAFWHFGIPRGSSHSEKKEFTRLAANQMKRSPNNFKKLHIDTRETQTRTVPDNLQRKEKEATVFNFFPYIRGFAGMSFQSVPCISTGTTLNSR